MIVRFVFECDFSSKFTKTQIPYVLEKELYDAFSRIKNEGFNFKIEKCCQIVIKNGFRNIWTIFLSESDDAKIKQFIELTNHELNEFDSFHNISHEID